MLVNESIASCRAAGAVLRGVMCRVCSEGCLHARGRLGWPA